MSNQRTDSKGMQAVQVNLNKVVTNTRLADFDNGYLAGLVNCQADPLNAYQLGEFTKFLQLDFHQRRSYYDANFMLLPGPLQKAMRWALPITLPIE